MVKKFDALAEALARKTVLKVEIRRLRRQAREEVRAMRKAGVSISDLAALERSIKSDQWLLQHRSEQGIREAVRQFGKIDVGRGIMINYKEYAEARANWKRYNQSVEAWNARHAQEIKAGTAERRFKKRWTVAYSPDDTQEDAEAWFKNLNENYSSPSAYYKGLWGTYITNTMKAIRRRCPVGLDFIIPFMEEQLKKHVPVTNGDYYELRYYYAEPDVLKAYRDIAQHYGFAQEFHDLTLQHKDEIANVKSWM